jgi:nicotinate-nucleotide adenylyltransferase
MTKGMRIGVFGGTFDPPHYGHLILAEEAGFELHLDRLLWVLTAWPPHKQGMAISDVDYRLELVQAAIAHNPVFELSRVEIDRPGPHYAVDTLHLLAGQYPDAELYYLMGGDSLHDLPTWHQPQQLAALVSGLVVMRRPEDAVDLEALESVLPGVAGKVQYLNVPFIEISSSDIRQRIASGRPFRYFLPPVVYDLIQQCHPYPNNSGEEDIQTPSLP